MRGRREDARLARIEDALSRLVAIFPAVAVLIARQRATLTQADIKELQTIVESAALARDVLAECRREITE
jgi:hypothetical protein